MMFAKLIVFFTLMIFIPLSLSSKCITKLLYVGPHLSELPTNPQLLLLVDDEMEQFIQDSLHKYPIIMVSGTDTVKLELIGRYPNEFNSIQYLAKTDRSLLQGKKYHAEIFSRSEKHLNYGRRFHIIITPRNHEWLIKDDFKVEKPKFLSPPKKIDGTYTNFSRPEVFDTYEIISNDNKYNLLEINVKRGDTELISYSTISDSKVTVGKGLCFGGYVFKESEQYDVSFTLVNSNGERSETIQMKNMISPSWETESKEFRMYMR